MLVEPPGSHLPAGQRLSAVVALRLGAAVAALVLAVTSLGDALGLAALLALAAWRPLPVAALGAALVASSWRWGSTSLEALAGAQAVLGLAGWVGPPAAAASAWLAAAAVVIAATRPLPLEVGGMAGPGGALAAPNLVGVGALAVAAGASAAAVVAGPAPGGAVLARVVAGVLASMVALAVCALRGRHHGLGRPLDIGAVLAGVAALVTATLDAGAWSGTISTAALREGATLALAGGGLVVVGTVAASAMGARRT